ncbi:MAG: hypothetical protein GXO65_05000 [Euryarchaeota archaeon]|nr:hypothetical protein [Euryarchaeota archaeon]
MSEEVKRYNVTIKGRVQDVGYRYLIESTANSLGIKGYVFNDIDGSVRLLCEGREEYLVRFFDSVDVKGDTVFVEDIQKEEAPMGAAPLPPRFARLETDAMEDFSRKLDIGIGSLQRIEENTGSLLGKTDALIEGQDKLLGGQNRLIEGQDKLLGGQNRLIEGQDELIEAQNRLVEGQGRQEGHLKDIKDVLKQIADKL